MPVFTPQQDAALQGIAQWWKEGRRRAPIFRLFGYAGTGKTTLVKHIAEDIKGKVLFAAFTGKAACVMRSKGCDGASTIHRLIYKPQEQNEENPTFELWHKAPAGDAKLIIIDECSMVDAELARDLMSFEVPLLVLGDPAQLPPIQGGGFFTDAKPDAMLTEVHRQAQDNPIVRLSMDIRAGKPLAQGQYGETQVVRRGELDPKRVIGADQVSGRAQRDAPRLQHTPARAARAQRRAADRWGQARLPAQQPPEKSVQRRAVDGEGAAEAQAEAEDPAPAAQT
jgi:exodeoxyribonuclease-5